jgi:peptidoglycan/xylan/chitin deacetylase (PgdA/CDA1 family)
VKHYAYHGVNNCIDDANSIDPFIFEEHIRYFHKNGFNTLTSLNTKNDDRVITLSFDDGYIDCIETVQPILAKYNYTAIVYIIVGALLRSKDIYHVPNTAKFMTVSHVQYLLSLGWRIGCHTNSHRRLIKLSKREKLIEIVDSKKQLEDIFSTPVDTFCYPGGWYDHESVNIIKESGYSSAVVTPRRCIDYINNYQINKLRIGINEETFNWKFKMKISKYAHMFRFNNLLYKELMKVNKAEDLKVTYDK